MFFVGKSGTKRTHSARAPSRVFSEPPQKAWRIIRSLVVGYIAEKEDPGGVMAEDEDKDDGGGATITNPFSDGKRSKNEAAAGAPGKSVLLFNNRQSLGADNLASV